MKTVVIPVVVGALGTVKKGMVENIKKVSERTNMTEIQKICMLGSAWILRKVLSVWTEWLTWVTDALGAWFASGWCTKRTPAKTVIIETIITIIIVMMNKKKAITVHSVSVFASPLAPSPCSPNSPPRKWLFCELDVFEALGFLIVMTVLSLIVLRWECTSLQV